VLAESLLSCPQAYHKKKKYLNAMMEEPEKRPEWLTTGMIYLLLKSGDCKEVRNYRPIT